MTAEAQVGPWATRLPALSDACGSWHFAHCPSATTLWVLFALAGITLLVAPGADLPPVARTAACRATTRAGCGTRSTRPPSRRCGRSASSASARSRRGTPAQSFCWSGSFSRYGFSWAPASDGTARSPTTDDPRERQTRTHARPLHLALGRGARWQSWQDLAANGACAFALKNFGSFEACGSWHRSQCMRAGSICTCASLKATVWRSWQLAHRVLTGWTRSRTSLDACGV